MAVSFKLFPATTFFTLLTDSTVTSLGTGVSFTVLEAALLAMPVVGLTAIALMVLLLAPPSSI